MKQTITPAIVLSRTNYQEADRILTLLTPEYGKLRLLAKGVRKSKSKMAGGIELFSVSEIGFLKGKGELGTLISSRLTRHYERIVRDIDRTMLGYELIKLLNRATEDAVEPDYFELLEACFAALDDETIPIELVRLWFYGQLLRIAGHTPNLHTQTNGHKLETERLYAFDYEDMAFRVQPNGGFGANHIKLLRLAVSNTKPETLVKIQDLGTVLPSVLQLLETVVKTHSHP